MEARFRSNKKITTKDFEREIEFLKDTEQMPSLDHLLRAMAEARQDLTRNSENLTQLKPWNPE
jgi:hypothetical protein